MAEEARAALKRLEPDWTRWIFFTWDRWRLDAKITKADRAAVAADQASHALQATVRKLDAEIRSLRGEVDQRSADTRGYPPEPEIRERRDRIDAGLDQIRERDRAIDWALAALAADVPGPVAGSSRPRCVAPTSTAARRITSTRS